VSVEVELRPPSPYRLPAYGGEDGVMRAERGILNRLLHVDGCPVLVRAWEPGRDRVAVRAEALDPADVRVPGPAAQGPERVAGPDELELALERMRFALGVDDDLSEFYRRFRRDPLLGPLLRSRPYLRARRRPWPWEALAWAVVKQLIETGRAARIQRRMVGRWGLRLGAGRDGLRDVPTAGLIAGRAPVELESMGLALKRAIAAVREIGPWTVQCVGLFGRGDPDSLPAGDLMYLKLVGRLARLGRRATVEEVEEFFAPYAPFRGLAATWSMTAAF
jgi:3-methyladenine DNA glycosylase/8-oxoguanine DNA glycosylase